MARKYSLDEHWLMAHDLTPEQRAVAEAEQAETTAMRRKALAWMSSVTFTVTTETEDTLSAADTAVLEAAIAEASGKSLRAWMDDPASVTLDGGWGHSGAIVRATPAGADVSGMLKAFQRGDYGAGWHVVCASSNPDAKVSFHNAWEEGDEDKMSAILSAAL